MLNQSTTLDRVFAALSDPSRRTILERLVRGSATVSELARPLDMTLSAVVQHVQVLVDSGLIRTAKTGRTRTCTLRPRNLERAGTWLVAQQEAFWKAGLREMQDIVENPQPATRRKKKEKD